MPSSPPVPIPARTGWSGRLAAGQSFRVIDVEGGQCADLWVFCADDPAEPLSAQHSRVHMEAIYPTAGWTFVTARRRPILRFVEDTSPGRHDCLVAACESARYEQLGAAPGHASCEENLRAEAHKQKIPVSFAPQPINVFANFRARRRPAGTGGVRHQGRRCGDVRAPPRWDRRALGLPPGHHRVPAGRAIRHGG
jgi:uncharacterized protein YcgI (DUF1989 family)